MAYGTVVSAHCGHTCNCGGCQHVLKGSVQHLPAATAAAAVVLVVKPSISITPPRPEGVGKKVRKDKNNEVVRSRRAVRWTLRWFSTT